MKLIATICSREISTSIILQAQSQLKAIYKDNADTIVGNCDSTLFLGGKEKTTLKELSETLGKETIDLFYQTNSILQNIRIISSLKTMIRGMYLILRNILNEKVKLR
ncbi:TraM recognition domain-containing protein [Treponema denticola]|uniref:TraM recognition domain-containing protein n=1 Tax=Treponema denticola TaxID=158 RepID=UPI003D6E2DF6